MTVEEQEEQDRQTLRDIESMLAEYKRVISLAWSRGLDIRIEQRPDGSGRVDMVQATWPTLTFAGRAREYINLHRKGF